MLHDLVAEASRALAHLDADRLEELSLFCRALNQKLPGAMSTVRHWSARQKQTIGQEVRTFSRVLEVTRGNLCVMRQVRDLEQGLLEYGDSAGRAWVLGGLRNGKH